MMEITRSIFILIVSAAAIRFEPQAPKPIPHAYYDDLLIAMFRSPDECEQHARELLAGIEGLLSENQTSRIQGIFNNLEHQNNLKFLLVGTKHTICMADNWFVHSMEATAQPSVFVYFALDEESHLSCVQDFQSRGGRGKQNHIIKCVSLSDLLPWSELTSANVVGFGTCIYQLITWMKPLLLKVSTSSVLDPSSLLLIDSDVVIHKDVQQLLSEGKTSIFQTGDEGRGNPNTGFVNINSNADDLLHMWLEQAPIVYGQSTADQAGLTAFLSSPKGMHFNEQMHLIPRNLLGMCANRGQYATHYNCVGNKYEAMQHDGNYRPAAQWCTDSTRAFVRESASMFDQELANLLTTR